MVVDLKQIFEVTGESLKFEYEIPASEVEDVCGYEFSSPIHVEGNFKNRAEIVTLLYSVKFTLKIVCDRCLKELERCYSYSFEHIVVQADTADDEYITADNEKVDVNKIAVSDLLLELPSKILCVDDCKGLCSVCGCDLNESECNCSK